MAKIYKIEVMMFPNNELDNSKPFFWCIMSNTGKDWCNETAGWESTPEKAWEEAIRFYRKYKTDEVNK